MVLTAPGCKLLSTKYGTHGSQPVNMPYDVRAVARISSLVQDLQGSSSVQEHSIVLRAEAESF
ncbi:hypothetical protein J6590_015061 [Homalodisca vitripennis]|nr:hypothetical protein J6590_015061 [Homalodisca vitripennis]